MVRSEANVNRCPPDRGWDVDGRVFSRAQDGYRRPGDERRHGGVAAARARVVSLSGGARAPHAGQGATCHSIVHVSLIRSFVRSFIRNCLVIEYPIHNGGQSSFHSFTRLFVRLSAAPT